MPTAATFQQLTCSLIAYNGLATFGFAADGSATTGGAVRDVRIVDAGSLISGGINFTFPPGWLRRPSSGSSRPRSPWPETA